MNEVTTGDQREPHMLDPPKFVELKDLEKLGLLYYQVCLNSRHFLALFYRNGILNV